MQISDTKIKIDYKARQVSVLVLVCVKFKSLCFYIIIHYNRQILSKKFLSTLKMTLNDHHQMLSNFKDVVKLHNSDISYVSHSIVVRFNCKNSEQRKGTNTLPVISVLINKAILGYISTLTLFLLKQSTHINLV